MSQQIMTKTEIIRMDLSDDSHKKAFYDLNVEWIGKYFYVEEIDYKIISQPEKIIENDGFILFVKYDDQIVGTISLIKTSDGQFELSKLAVSENYKGLGLGKKLMDALIEQTRAKGIKKIYLTSTRSLLPAINLYKKYGFVESKEDRHSVFKRANITMEYFL